MKTHKLILTATLIIGTASFLVAQENRPQQGNRPPGGNQQQPQQGNRQGGFGGPGGGQGQRPSFPLVDALDANKNREIDANEIANATAALKKLDKNGDGKLSGDEFMPQRPGGQGGQGGPGGQRPGGSPSGSQSSPSQGQRERPKSE